MSVRSKKPTAFDRRIKRIERELSEVNHEIRSLTKSVEKSGRSLDMARLQAMRRGGVQSPVETVPGAARAPAPEREAAPQPVARNRPGQRPDRLVDYLATSVEAIRPLRHERLIQRNKAIVMIVFVLVVLAAVLFRFLR